MTHPSLRPLPDRRKPDSLTALIRVRGELVNLLRQVELKKLELLQAMKDAQ